MAAEFMNSHSKHGTSRICGMSPRSGVPRAWADLPREILSLIGKFLATPLDVSCFITVCKNWRSSLSVPTTSKPNPNPGILSPFLPLQIPNSANLPFNDRPSDSLILVASAVFLVQPIDSNPNSKGWLLTVEERKAGKLKLLKPLSKNPLGVDLPPKFPNCVSLIKLRVTEIAKGYSFRYAGDGKYVSGISRVVLCSSFSFRDCTAMVLCGNGVLVGVRIRNGQWDYVRHSLISPFVDVGMLEGVVYGVTDKAHVYEVDHLQIKVTYPIVRYHSSDLRGEMQRKGLKSLNHYLMEYEGALYLVVWNYDCYKSSSEGAFEVYKLDIEEGKWIYVNSFGYGVLFASPSWCFVVFDHYRIDFKGKVVVYSRDCFNSSCAVDRSCSLFRGHAIDLDIHLALMHMNDRIRKPCSLEIDIADMMWPPPSWFWPSIGDEELEEEQPEFYNQHSPACSDELPCAFKQQDLNGDVSKVMFEGVDISSDLVPILQKVWAKYGNMLEGSSIHSKFMISSALESLAEVIIILEGNSGTTLSAEQCKDICSILCDLKHLNVRVDWLLPYVEKAVALHISKPMIAALTELEKAIARANELKMKLSNDSANNIDELAKALEKDQMRIFERMPISGAKGLLDQCLAKGLF